MSINNDRGFFVVLMVALVSFALWATMSTMHIYSVNKMEAHAKAKEANEMYNTLSDFASEAQAGYYRSVIENQGEEGTDCPIGYDNCTLDEGGGTKPNLCLKEESCNTCLDASNGKNVVEYCGTFFGFSGKDDLGDCSSPEVLCVAASIDVADRKNPPSSTDLKDCDTCFVQPFKIFVDTPVTTTTTDPPISCPTTHPFGRKPSCGDDNLTSSKKIGKLTCWTSCQTPSCWVRIEGSNIFCKWPSEPRYEVPDGFCYNSGCSKPGGWTNRKITANRCKTLQPCKKEDCCLN